MGRKVPPGQQAMGELLPTSIVLVEGQHFETRPTKNGKHAYASRATVIEPAELAGQTLFDQFVLGSDNDPEATEEATLLASFGMKRLVSMFDAIGQDIRGEDEEGFPEWFIGNRFLASVVLSTQPALNNDGSPNAYAGQEQNQVKRYFAVGEREPMIVPSGTATTGTPAKAKAAPQKAAPTPAPQQAKPAPKAAAAPAPKPNGATAAPKKTAQTIKCMVPECGFEGTIQEFPKHVQETHPD